MGALVVVHNEGDVLPNIEKSYLPKQATYVEKMFSRWAGSNPRA